MWVYSLGWFVQSVLLTMLGAVLSFAVQASALDKVNDLLKDSTTQQALDVVEFGATALNSTMGPADAFVLGREAAARLLDDNEVLPFDHSVSQYVHKIGTTLQLASHVPYTYRPATFVVVDVSSVNAFAAPGGIILVHRGILDFVDNEDQLAAILAHEIGHLEMDHGLRAVGREKVYKLVGMLADLAKQESMADVDPALKKQVDKLLGSVMSMLYKKIKNGYSVDMESEADQRAVALLKAAGYDPYAMLTLIEQFKAFTGSYGGAGYPQQRGQLVREALTSQGITTKQVRPETRESRFNRIVEANETR